MQEKCAIMLDMGLLGVLLRDALIAKATFSVSALTAAHLLGEYPRYYCGPCSAAFHQKSYTGCFTKIPRQCRIQVVNQFPCYCIGALASIF